MANKLCHTVDTDSHIWCLLVFKSIWFLFPLFNVMMINNYNCHVNQEDLAFLNFVCFFFINLYFIMIFCMHEILFTFKLSL